VSYTYYPGCSLKGTGKHGAESLTTVFEALGHELNELDDWNCCGATAYMGIDQAQALALAARNLSLAEKEKLRDLVAPCNACYFVLRRVDDYRTRYPDLMNKVLGALRDMDLDYQGNVAVRHPLDVLIDDIGVDEIKKHVGREMNGVRVACYYGCLYSRPYGTPEEWRFPTRMEELFTPLGVEAIDYPLRTRCCGGSLTGTVEDVGRRLVYRLLHEAKRLGADMIVTLCSLCQFNLEAYQGAVGKQFSEDVRMPVLYFTQLLGLLMGLPEKKLGLHRLFVPPPAALTRA
jgi:heterodisulfide reductase subunit B